MEVSAKFGSGRALRELIDETQQGIRKEPARMRHRISLFQLMCVTGNWERALTQLNVLKDGDEESASMVKTYTEVIRCENFRAQVFAGTKTPLLIGEPAGWVGKVIEAVRLSAQGHAQHAADLRAEAFDLAPAVSGTLNATPFEWIADADPRLGPLIEAVINGKYCWIPFDRLSAIEVEAPVDMRDLVWAAAKLTFTSGGEQVAFIPSRYPGSESSEEDAIRLSRRTEWRDAGAETFLGLGQRILATSEDEVPLLDTRIVKLNSVAA